MAGAIVTPASPSIYVSSLSEVDGYTIYGARVVGSAFKKRMMPMPTPRCLGSTVTCPDLRGGFKCIDTMTDIFSTYTYCFLWPLPALLGQVKGGADNGLWRM
jgi:hypothetical protein